MVTGVRVRHKYANNDHRSRDWSDQQDMQRVMASTEQLLQLVQSMALQLFKCGAPVLGPSCLAACQDQTARK